MPAIAVHHTATVDEVWDASAAVAAMPAEASVLHYCHAWEKTAGSDTKDDYSFPHAKSEGGPANVRACRNILARVGNSSIPAGDKAGVRKHAQAHLDDANKSASNSRVLMPAGFHNFVARTRHGEQPHAQKWYKFSNAAGSDDAQLYIYGPIGGWFGVTAEDFVQDLADVGANTLTVRINSNGGDAFEGITIMNLLRNHPATVNVVVDGLAASAGSLIAMGGDSLAMAPGSQLMIHRALASVYGNVQDMRETIDILTKLDSSLAAIYQARAGGDLAAWESAMAIETWYSADEAVAAGLADHITEPPSKSGEAENAYNDLASKPNENAPGSVSPEIDWNEIFADETL